MFLCEVGMNNTLAGLLHPQADEKMFNFSKCSTRSLSLFHPPSPLICERCRRVCAFSVALICFFFCFVLVVFTVGLGANVRHHKQKAAKPTSGPFPRKRSVTSQPVVSLFHRRAKERQNGARQPGPHTDERPLRQPGGLSHRRHLTDAACCHSSA